MNNELELLSSPLKGDREKREAKDAADRAYKRQYSATLKDVARMQAAEQARVDAVMDELEPARRAAEGEVAPGKLNVPDAESGGRRLVAEADY